MAEELGLTPHFPLLDGEAAADADGRIEMTDGIEAVRQWLDCNLRIEPGEYDIYDGAEIGVPFSELFGAYRAPSDAIKSELERHIEETVLQCPAVDGVSSMEVTNDHGTLTVELQLDTVYGDAGYSTVSDTSTTSGTGTGGTISGTVSENASTRE